MNLLRSLFGIWPRGDFDLYPTDFWDKAVGEAESVLGTKWRELPWYSRESKVAREEFADLRRKVLGRLMEEYKTQHTYKHLQQEGGGEGGSEYCYGVFEFDGKVYKAEWSYYSHMGCEYDDIVDTLREVKPAKKTITVYE